MALTSSKYTVKEIDDLRSQYVKQFRKANGGKQQVKYLGVVSPESIAEEGMEQFKKKILKYKIIWMQPASKKILRFKINCMQIFKNKKRLAGIISMKLKMFLII